MLVFSFDMAFRSEPTYEGLKLPAVVGRNLRPHRSEPTYEGLKHEPLDPPLGIVHGSEPTYEGLKRPAGRTCSSCLRARSEPTYEGLKPPRLC